MGAPPFRSGLGIGTALVAAVWALAIVGFLGHLAVARKDAAPRTGS
jgi:hypothetical protein